MNASIFRRAFGVIELLVVLLIVSVLAVTLLRTHTVKMSHKLQGLETRLKDDLSRPSALTRLTTESLTGAGPTETFIYSLAGAVPDQRLIRMQGAATVTLVEHVSYLRISAFDGDGRYLGDEPSAERLKETDRIRLDLRTHNGAEDPNYFMNDGVHGTDLDHDPGNGIAHLTSHTLTIHIRAH
ncbi:MAG: hypothetical protein V1798_00560 [Pseudomonadota bacterium]